MDLSAREPTSPARSQLPTAAAVPARIDTSLGFASQPYPSPVHERVPPDTAQYLVGDMAATSPNGAGPASAAFNGASLSPHAAAPPKQVQFVLVFQKSPFQARLPLRVAIYPHDTTDSIITTVKNFYGLYSGPGVSKGVSFEDEGGNTLIARYENFRHNMTVHVRVIEEPLGPNYQVVFKDDYHPHNVNGYLAAPDAHENQGARLRSPSPSGSRGRRSTPAGSNPAGSKKGRSRSSRSRTQMNGDGQSDSFNNGYSSGDGAPGSSSGRVKEQLGTTDISVENIVEGGRRKRAKFESSELPLFAPPQMPAATSNPSVSPARRAAPHRDPLPPIHQGLNPFSHPQPLHSPPAYSSSHAASGAYGTPASDNRRGRPSFGIPPGSGTGVMLTPDPTVGSCVSEEDKDLAMQLVWFKNQARASASTMDDGYSGMADATSSAGATSEAESDCENEMPPAQRQKVSEHLSDSRFAGPKSNAEASGDDDDCLDETSPAGPAMKGIKLKANTLIGVKARQQLSQKGKSSKSVKPKPKKAASTPGPMTPSSLPASRKPSIASNPALPLFPGEEEQPDLSTKPRCQRCRKSKKGCDRQRPCGRCRDAGIPAELCISEDEGNGRKGRYGRHMGVPIKKEDMPPPPTSLLPAPPIATDAPTFLASAADLLEKNKKRKR